jgi:hypothetical protein
MTGASPTTAVTTIGFSILDMPSIREESSWEAPERLRRAHPSDGRQPQNPAKQASIDPTDMPAVLTVSLRTS